MALASTKRITTIVLDADMDRLLDRAARDARTSRSEFIRVQLRRALEKYRPHPAPRSAGAVKGRFREPGTERNLFSKLER
jgi:metal-responsive CopG/Arc/MetJ family transcriptional regulator